MLPGTVLRVKVNSTICAEFVFFKLKDAPWKESYDKLSVLKSRDITLLRKVPTVKAMVFPVAM